MEYLDEFSCQLIPFQESIRCHFRVLLTEPQVVSCQSLPEFKDSGRIGRVWPCTDFSQFQLFFRLISLLSTVLSLLIRSCSRRGLLTSLANIYRSWPFLTILGHFLTVLGCFWPLLTPDCQNPRCFRPEF